MKIGIQSSATTLDIGYAEAYRLFAEAGFESIDWNINDALKPSMITNGTYVGNNVFEKDIEEIIEYFNVELTEIKRNGLEIHQAHAPFPAYVPDKPEVLDYMIEVYKKCIMLCQEVGCKYLVIHGVSLARKDRGNTPESVRALNDKLYTSLIPTLIDTEVTVCLENLFTGAGGICAGVCSNPYEAVEMIDNYNAQAGKECFGLCLDTGHLNLVKQDVRYYIPILNKRIKALHIHDNDGLSDTHKAPYTGTIVWKDFCDELRKIGYNGDITFETFNQTSLKVIDRELLTPWLKLICQIGYRLKNIIERND
ncbi:MAG: sugar phosphate isomerase/epimerase [Clostridia bacterium]|nr:sugar phosphate isomerase/epimerase [Clostridia bacterium]